ncbi:hypothetical protein T484DRAFT_1902763, partial [Baffinella frigidus]
MSFFGSRGKTKGGESGEGGKRAPDSPARRDTLQKLGGRAPPPERHPRERGGDEVFSESEQKSAALQALKTQEALFNVSVASKNDEMEKLSVVLKAGRSELGISVRETSSLNAALAAKEDAVLGKGAKLALMEHATTLPLETRLAALEARSRMLEHAATAPEGLWSADDEPKGALLARLKTAQHKAFVLDGTEAALRTLVLHQLGAPPAPPLSSTGTTDNFPAGNPGGL